MRHRRPPVPVSLLVLLGVLLVVRPGRVDAQSRRTPAPPQPHPIALVNATIHTVRDGTIREGYVVFRDGVITEVGPGAYESMTDEVTTIDVGGRHVYPGLISADTAIGLIEIGAVRATRDLAEVGGMTPEVRAGVAVNPDSALIPVARANGILTALVAPRGGVISGHASLMRLDGWTTEDMTIDDRAGLVVRWPRMRPARGWWISDSPEEQMTRAEENLARIRDFIEEARAYVRARDAEPERHPVDVRLEAMRDVLEGHVPVFVHADDAAQIRSAVAWGNREDLRLVLVGGHEADQCADLLLAHDIPVILRGVHRMPGRRDAAFDEPFTLPARLHEAGLHFCIASDEEPAHERSLPYHAAMAAAYGLPPDVALASVTANAADIIGLGDTHGAIAPGMAATLIVTTGSPLEITTDVVRAFIDGSEIDLDSKHTDLYRKYRTRYERMGLIAPAAEENENEGGDGSR